MAYARRTDSTHAAIRDTFRVLGFLVWDVRGAIDLVVRDRAKGQNHLVDAKGEDTPMTQNQIEMVEAGWEIHFVRSVDEAIELAQRWRKS